jgi:hypothetical protein
MEQQKYISLGKHIIRFGGNSTWSNLTEPKDVEVHVVIDYVIDADEDYESTSILALFEEDQWSTIKNGDIYTDPSFKESIKAVITEHGYSDSLGYSESGMQHECYVHFDLSANDKLKNEKGNYEVDWEALHEKAELINLKVHVVNGEQELEQMKARIKELEKNP